METLRKELTMGTGEVPMVDAEVVDQIRASALVSFDPLSLARIDSAGCSHCCVAPGHKTGDTAT
jgi:hypothetical protein